MRAPKLQFECDIPFVQLEGEGPVRHCASCDKTVTDISALTEEETRQVLAKGGCITFLRTHDGQLASTKKRSLQVLRPAAMAAAFAAAACQSGELGTRTSGATVPIDAATQPTEHTDEPRLMGEFAPGEPTTPATATPDATVPRPTRGRVSPTAPTPSTGTAPPPPPPPHRTAGVPMPPPQNTTVAPLPPAK